MEAEPDNHIALVVDLDDTLLRSDSLWESAVRAVADRPRTLLRLPGWLRQGKAVLKHALAASVLPQVGHWPYNQDVLGLLRSARKAGRTTCLATAADQTIADAVAAHLGLFDLVIGSRDGVNLKGGRKLEKLLASFGEGGFDYIGDSASDLPIWAKCRRAFLVGSEDSSLAKSLAAVKPGFTVMPESRPTVKTVAKTLRVHQWVKNLLLFVPFVLYRDFTVGNAVSAILAFTAFCCCASAIYVVNDLADLPSDRQHPKKRRRPFASGAMPLRYAPFLFGVLLVAGLAAVLCLPASFALTIFSYFALTFLYSFRLKRVVMLDVIILAGFYVLRIMAGTKALDLPFSNWLIGFACFIFLGLGILKRSTELQALRARNTDRTPGRGYQTRDVGILENMATVSGFCSIVILALYIDSFVAGERYTTPFMLWGLCPLITYWYGRILIISHRGDMHTDPVDFVLTDRYSWYCGAIALALLVLSV